MQAAPSFAQVLRDSLARAPQPLRGAGDAPWRNAAIDWRAEEIDSQTSDEVTRALRRLGLRVGASANDVRQAFRERARESHPDRGGDARAFRELLAAYETALPAAR
jgi:DnaJ-domain-containing protein 1